MRQAIKKVKAKAWLTIPNRDYLGKKADLLP